MEGLFLSIDDDKPLSVFWDCGGFDGYEDLDKFLEYSKEDMSKELAARYAERFQKFVDDLREYAET